MQSAVTKALKAKEQADFDQARKIGKLIAKANRKTTKRIIEGKKS